MFSNSRFIIATHVLTLLAMVEEPMSSPWIAGSVGVNPVTVRKIVKTLRDAGLVETISGSAGGARLAKPSNTISLRDIYEVMHEGMVFGVFPDSPSPNCKVGRNMQGVLADIADDTEQNMIAPLADVSIASLLERVEMREAAN